MTLLELRTAAYPAFKAGMGVPVRTSQGRPKYPLAYTLEFKAPVLFPHRNLLRLQMDEFEPEYREQLDRMGVDNIRTQLEMIAEATKNKRLILMCFEKSPKQCHRGIFAEWWRERTGEAVLEIR